MLDVVEEANAIIHGNRTKANYFASKFVAHFTIPVSRAGYMRLEVIAEHVGKNNFFLPNPVCNGLERFYVKCADVVLSVPLCTPATGAQICKILREFYSNHGNGKYCGFSYKQKRSSENNIDVFLSNINLFRSGKYFFCQLFHNLQAVNM